VLVLGIETTCDETAAALVQDGRTIISHVIASSAQAHEIFGGVVPELASRYHIESIIPTIQSCLNQSPYTLEDIDLIAVAKGPGLIGSLLVGIQTAEALSWALQKPLIGINHIEAHLYASMMTTPDLSPYLPSLGLIISGGHTTLLNIHDIGSYSVIGQTVDDAAGEAFDKVAKMLNLGYPGGPQVEALAKQGNSQAFNFKAGTIKNDPHSFSFSGLKTAVLYAFQKISSPTHQDLCNICASFQEAVLANLCLKIKTAINLFQPKALFCGGGVSQNAALRERFQQVVPLPLFWPPKDLCLDNAAMIAGLAYHQWQKNPIDEKFGISPSTQVFLGKKGGFAPLNP
jgi:N6-L-threonylcarbamoyladenine synthase